MMHALLLCAALFAGEPRSTGSPGGAEPAAPSPASAPPRFNLLAHAGVGAYRLTISDLNGSAASRAPFLSGGAAGTLNISPALGLGAFAELTDFLPEGSGGSSTFAFLGGPAAVYRIGSVAFAGGVGFSYLGQSYGAGPGALLAADIAIAGPVSLHFQATIRRASRSGGSSTWLAAGAGIGLVY